MGAAGLTSTGSAPRGLGVTSAPPRLGAPTPKAEFASGVERHQPLAPGRRAARTAAPAARRGTRWRSRCGDRRGAWRASSRSACRGRAPRACVRAQHRARLDQMTRSARRNSGRFAPRAARRHQRAAAGAEFDQAHRVGPPHRRPGLRRPEADEFAEHLRDFRRGGEIALGAEWIVVHVIAVFGSASASSM